MIIKSRQVNMIMTKQPNKKKPKGKAHEEYIDVETNILSD